MSTISLLYEILKGNLVLHSSQSSFLNFKITYRPCTFVYRLVSSQPLRHLRWIIPIVPAHLQGEIRGLNSSANSGFFISSSSVPQQIRHWCSLSSETLVGLIRSTSLASTSSFLSEVRCSFFSCMSSWFDRYLFSWPTPIARAWASSMSSISLMSIG